MSIAVKGSFCGTPFVVSYELAGSDPGKMILGRLFARADSAQCAHLTLIQMCIRASCAALATQQKDRMLVTVCAAHARDRLHLFAGDTIWVLLPACATRPEVPPLRI